jgi:hypothetical protein
MGAIAKLIPFWSPIACLTPTFYGLHVGAHFFKLNEWIDPTPFGILNNVNSTLKKKTYLAFTIGIRSTSTGLSRACMGVIQITVVLRGDGSYSN